MSKNWIRRAGPPPGPASRLTWLYHARSAMWKIGLIPTSSVAAAFSKRLAERALGRGADHGRVPSPWNRENPPQIQAGIWPNPGRRSMQILHRFVGSIQRYSDELSDPNRYRPDHCPQCEAHRPLRAHGFYRRTLVDTAFDGVIRIRRTFAAPANARCRCCRTLPCRICASESWSSRFFWSRGFSSVSHFRRQPNPPT